MWQVLGKKDTFPVFCVLLMATGVLSYCLAGYQIFLGLEEDKVGTGSDEEAGVEVFTDMRTTKKQEDIRAIGGGLGEGSSKNATVRTETGRERKVKKKITSTCRLSKDSIELNCKQSIKGLSCSMEMGRDPVMESSAERVPGKSGSRHNLGSGLNVEMEIPGLVWENSENKEFGAESNQMRKKGTITYLGFNARDNFPMSDGPNKTWMVDDACAEVACSRKRQVSKTAQPSLGLQEPTGTTWQLLGNEWVEIKIKKNL